MADVVTTWNQFILTDNGLEMRQQAIAGANITFDYAKIGEGVPTEPSLIPLMTDLVSAARQVPVIRTLANSVTHFVGARIDNAQFTQPILLREIGLFASIGNEPPTLYGYSYATQGYDSIPAGSVSHYVWTIGIDTVLSRSSSITFVYDGSAVFATLDDVDQLIQAWDSFRSEIGLDGFTSKLDNHIGAMVMSENGVHGIRYFNGKLQVFNGENWIDATPGFYVPGVLRLRGGSPETQIADYPDGRVDGGTPGMAVADYPDGRVSGGTPFTL
jgi:hypothetical protein